jgi:ribulose-phosphate 3-epimerase
MVKARAIRIAPSILSADFGRLAEEAGAIEAGGGDWLHVDVMDGRFVPNMTIGPVVVKALKKATKLPLDVHLMIVEPERYLEAFVEAGAERLSVHAEACPHLHRTLQQIHALGAKASVALNPSTPLSAIEWVLEDLDMVLLMSVNPGFGGQSYIPQSTRKMAELRKMVDARGLAIDLEVDGGIRPDTGAAVAAAGADVLVAGSSIFESRDYAAAITALRRSAESAARKR